MTTTLRPPQGRILSSGFEGIPTRACRQASCGLRASLFRTRNPSSRWAGAWVVGAQLGPERAAGLGDVPSAREHRSIALEADARHLVTDVWTSAGVLVGIAGAALTGWLWLDAVAAIAVALNILERGRGLVWRSSQGLMDSAVEPEAVHHRRHAAAVCGGPGAGCALRLHVPPRRAGQRQFVDMHLHMPADWTLRHAAELRGQVERAID